MNKILLIDGHSILNRAFYGLPDLTNYEGLHTNAVLGFLNIIFKIMDEEKPDHMCVAFDVHEPTFRHLKYSAYKGTRKTNAGGASGTGSAYERSAYSHACHDRGKRRI